MILVLLIGSTIYSYTATLSAYLSPKDGKYTIKTLDFGAYGGGGTPTIDPAYIKTITPEKAAEELRKLDPDIVAGIFKQIDPELIAAILNEMEVDFAAKVLDELSFIYLLPILDAAGLELTVSLFNEFSMNTIQKILKKIEENQMGFYAGVLNAVDDDIYVNILPEMENELASKFLKIMVGQDHTGTAKKIEAAIKMTQEEPDPVKAQQILDKVLLILKTLESKTLADLLLEIAIFPNTPSTVAYIIHMMDVATSQQVVSSWIASGDVEVLAEVFGLLTPEYLSSIYLGLASDERVIIYEHLNPTTLEVLPILTEFRVFNLDVSPSQVKPGESVTASVEVSNIGEEVGSYTILLKIDNTKTSEEDLILEAGESKTLYWDISRVEEGSHIVDVNGVTSTYIVELPPKPAAFRVYDMKINPDTVKEGEETTVTVKVENTGELSGDYAVNVLVDNILQESQTVDLDGGQSTKLSFQVMKMLAGSYSVVIDSEISQFTVERKPGIPWSSILVVFLFVAFGGGYYQFIYKPSKDKEDDMIPDQSISTF